VGDHQDTKVGAAHLLDSLSDFAHGIHVEAGVEFVEDGHAGSERQQLRHLRALLLAAGEADIDRSIPEDRGVEPLGDFPRSMTDRFAACLCHLGNEVAQCHPWNLDRVLKHLEESRPGATVDVEPEHIGAGHLGDSGHGVSGPSHECMAERRLPRAVRPHHHVEFPERDLQIEVPDDVQIAETNIEPFNPESVHVSSSTMGSSVVYISPSTISTG